MFGGYSADTGVEVVDKLLNRGGMWSMAQTVWLILSAMLMAGVFSSIGVFENIASALINFTKKTASLIWVTLSNCVLMNLIAGDQYISIIVPGQIWRKEYERRRLAAINLSRCLEDAGTLTSPLIPWTTCGAYIYGVLGLTSFAYIPFCSSISSTPLYQPYMVIPALLSLRKKMSPHKQHKGKRSSLKRRVHTQSNGS